MKRDDNNRRVPKKCDQERVLLCSGISIEKTENRSSNESVKKGNKTHKLRIKRLPIVSDEKLEKLKNVFNRKIINRLNEDLKIKEACIHLTRVRIHQMEWLTCITVTKVNINRWKKGYMGGYLTRIIV